MPACGGGVYFPFPYLILPIAIATQTLTRCAGVAYIAKKANLGKFSYRAPGLREQLDALGGRELVYADPFDAFLGVGFGVGEAGDVCRSNWGANVFGKAVEVARRELRIGPRDLSELDRLVDW